MRSLWKPILQSAGAGVANRVGSIAVRVVTIPLLLRHLGTERYGLWMTIASITAYVTLLDFGIVSALVNKLTARFYSGRNDRANTYVLATTTFLTIVAVVGGALVLFALSFVNLPDVLHLRSVVARDEVAPTVAITVLMAGLQLATDSLLRVPYTMQRGYITEGYSLAGNVASLVGILVGVRLDLGLPFLAGVLMVGPVLAALAIAVHLAVEGSLRWYAIGSRRMRAVLRVLMKSASDFVVMQGIATLLVALQFTLLAVICGAEAVTPYGLMSQALVAMQIPLSVLQQPLWTRLAALYHVGDVASVRRVFGQYLRAALLYAALAAAVLVFLVNPVLALVFKKQIQIALSLRIGFAVSCALGLVAGGNLGSLLLAVNLSRANAVLSVVQLVVFVALAALLTPRWGAAGMVWAVNATYLAALPVLVRRVPAHLGIGRREATAVAAAA